MDSSFVNCVDRSSDLKYLVSGDDFHRVKLFKNPSPRQDSLWKEYKGHADEVTNVRFSFDDKYVFSVGGNDKSILQFELVKHKTTFTAK